MISLLLGLFEDGTLFSVEVDSGYMYQTVYLCDENLKS